MFAQLEAFPHLFVDVRLRCIEGDEAGQQPGAALLIERDRRRERPAAAGQRGLVDREHVVARLDRRRDKQQRRLIRRGGRELGLERGRVVGLRRQPLEIAEVGKLGRCDAAQQIIVIAAAKRAYRQLMGCRATASTNGCNEGPSRKPSWLPARDGSILRSGEKSGQRRMSPARQRLRSHEGGQVRPDRAI